MSEFKYINKLNGNGGYTDIIHAINALNENQKKLIAKMVDTPSTEFVNASAQNVLDRIASILEVGEGESITETARVIMEKYKLAYGIGISGKSVDFITIDDTENSGYYKW